MNFSEAMYYENCLTTDFHTNTVILGRICLLVKMASKTVIRPKSKQPIRARFHPCMPSPDLFHPYWSFGEVSPGTNKNGTGAEKTGSARIEHTPSVNGLTGQM